MSIRRFVVGSVINSGRRNATNVRRTVRNRRKLSGHVRQPHLVLADAAGKAEHQPRRPALDVGIEAFRGEQVAQNVDERELLLAADAGDAWHGLIPFPLLCIMPDTPFLGAWAQRLRLTDRARAVLRAGVVLRSRLFPAGLIWIKFWRCD